MSDDTLPPNNPDPDHSDVPEIAPSTIFVELMRQAAARRQQEQAPPAPPPPPTIEAEADMPPTAPEPAPVPHRLRQRLRIEAEALPPVAPPDSPEPTLPVPPSDLPPPSDPAPVAPPPAPEVDEVRMEAQRIQRVQRRREKVQKQRAGILGGFLRTTLMLIVAGGLASTIFTWFTSPDFLDNRVTSRLVVAESTGLPNAQPSALPTPNYLRKIGIVSGHRGPQNDPGAVCADGLTEASITFAVSTRVVRSLRALGYSVDLLDEFDARLDNYQAATLVSIHANTCQDFGEPVSGFIVAKAAARPQGGIDDLLAECIALNYGNTVGLERRFSLTEDMTDYHSFREIYPLTPASIIELGFMKDDREVLTTREDAMARAITDGILCFLSPDANNPNSLLATPDFFARTPTPTPIQ